MGVRFHRSVRITKGVRLNISKRELGVSLGPQGAKISFGPSGVYSNVGKTGSGLYSRTKLNGQSNHKTSSRRTSSSNNKVTLNLDTTITIDDETGAERIMESTNALLDIHQHSEEIPNWEDLLGQSKTKKPELYVKKKGLVERLVDRTYK
jgi:hypothetical protein